MDLSIQPLLAWAQDRHKIGFVNILNDIDSGKNKDDLFHDNFT